MKYNQLGSTGIFVSELCFGAMTFGSEGMWGALGALGQEDADTLVHRALGAGVTFFDTADVYAHGSSEAILGKALGARRKDVVLATKVRARVGAGPNQVGLSRLHILRAVDDSLRRLGTDYIDLYQIHGFDPVTPLEETMRALDDLVRSGKVRYLGCSNLYAWETMKANGVADRLHLERFSSLQVHYALTDRGLEREIVPMAQDQRLAILVWSPLSGGLLSGKFRRIEGGSSDSRRAQLDFPPVDKERGYDMVEAMIPMAEGRGGSVAQIALSWLLRREAVTSVIIGAKRVDQLNDNLAATEVRLSEEETRTLDRLSSVPSEYPGWMRALPPDRLPGQSRRL